jgi:DNA-binding transcriptional MerR regulator
MARRATEETQERRAEVVRLRRRGVSFEDIGDALGVTKQRAHQIYRAALDEIPAQEVAEYRAEQAERLDEMLRKAYEVLERKHITVNNGKVIYLGEEPMEDDAPTLMAIKTILQIEERRAKLLGLDTPVVQKVAGEMQVTYAFEGVNMEDLT